MGAAGPRDPPDSFRLVLWWQLTDCSPPSTTGAVDGSAFPSTTRVARRPIRYPAWPTMTAARVQVMSTHTADGTVLLDIEGGGVVRVRPQNLMLASADPADSDPAPPRLQLLRLQPCPIGCGCDGALPRATVRAALALLRAQPAAAAVDAAATAPATGDAAAAGDAVGGGDQREEALRCALARGVVWVFCRRFPSRDSVSPTDTSRSRLRRFAVPDPPVALIRRLL